MGSKYGSLEVYFVFPSDVDKSIQLLTNVQGVRQFGVGPEILDDVSVKITSTREVGEFTFIQVQTLLGTTVVDQSDFSTYTQDDISFALRIFFFDQFISVSCNDKWVYSYALATVSYEDTVTTSLKMDGDTTTITDIRRVELADGREAIFVDYESTTESAIQSIIQQRPIQVIPHVNRKLSFTYRAERDTVTAAYVHRYEERVTHPPQMSTDGLVYGNDVGISIDLDTAEEVGFITRLYRLPELNTGAIQAAEIMQRQARQRRVVPKVTMRFDPRLELTDVLHIDRFASGTGRHIDRQIIIEGYQISIRDGEYSMTVTGRKKQ